MKPEDLKSPFSWNERTITIKDRVWYVPDQYTQFETFQFPGWNHADIFEKELPIKVEYCSGNGAWIASRAQRDPLHNWVAVERKFARVKKIWSKVKNFQLSNLLAVCGEALKITHHYFPDSSVAEVFINFPDPWPKRRHAKYRLIQPPFIQELYRILQPEGKMMIVTDDPGYSKQVIKEFQHHLGFQSLYPAPFYVTEYPDYGTSYFEDLWREKGKFIHYHRFQKVSVSQ